MDILHKILAIGFLILSMNLSGQELRILNTKDLITISNDFGLDSALNLTTGISFYYIDTLTAHELIKHTAKNKPSDKIEYYLVDYALHFKDSVLPETLYSFFKRKLLLIANYEPDFSGGLPEFSNDALIALTRFSNDSIENLLIKSYKAWRFKSANYKANYDKGLQTENDRKKERLITPYQDCNLNCYKLLLALKSIDSDFFSDEKLQEHNSKLKDYNQNMYLYESGNFFDYLDTANYEIIDLQNSYSNIGEIDFKKESTLKNLIKGYSKRYCWKFLLYNENTGYLDLGCQSAPLAGIGVMYKIELIENNKIKITTLSTWIS